MYILSLHESRIYELIRVGFQPSDIAKMPAYHKLSSLYTVIQRLTTLGFLEKQRLDKRTVFYTSLVVEYEIVDSKGLRTRKRHKVIPVNVVVDEPFQHIKVTNEQLKLIFELCMSGKRTSAISSKLGLPRYVVNKEIIKMGIEQD